MNGLSDTENTGKGFEGCIYRMQIDNIYPLKRAFQDPRPSFIKPVPEGNRKLSLSSLSQWNTCYFYNIRCLISLFYCILYSVKIPFQINISLMIFCYFHSINPAYIYQNTSWLRILIHLLSKLYYCDEYFDHTVTFFGFNGVNCVKINKIKFEVFRSYDPLSWIAGNVLVFFQEIWQPSSCHLVTAYHTVVFKLWQVC